MMQTLAPGVARIALRSPTLPPATHTNCYLVGEAALSVFDPASPWEDERQRLIAALDEDGRPVERIVLTHHHHDHVAGAVALQEHLASRGQQVPIVAHELTASLLRRSVEVQQTLVDEQVLLCGDVPLRCVHTPGHAPGHLVFLEVQSGMVVAGDMVAGVGTILLLPGEGHLGDYLDSLARMRLLGAQVLLPSHGPMLEDADATLAYYIDHRNERSDQVRGALKNGDGTPMELVPLVYGELPIAVRPFAAMQLMSHLEWLRGRGEVVEVTPGSWRVVA
jgi:ribonuclease/clavin/mitogillin